MQALAAKESIIRNLSEFKGEMKGGLYEEESQMHLKVLLPKVMSPETRVM